VLDPTAEPPTAEADQPTAAPPTEAAAEATAIPTAQAPIGGVTANNQWSPQEREFNGMIFVQVPAGCFEMGAVGVAATLSEGPPHQQCINAPFWIGTYEVTNLQVRDSGVDTVAEQAFRGDEVPRSNLTWFEARSVCESFGGRLPTEVEWEFAARGPDGLTWPFGELWQPGFIIHAANATSPVAVGQYREGASWVGAFDMSGNVREWVSSAQGSYPYDASDGRENDTSSANPNRITRGGSWQSGKDFVRLTYREWYDWNGYTTDIGFRCARDAQPGE
jgi:formylglycine-generating enzyme required for sulfatase activity